MATTVETLSKTLRSKSTSLAFAWLADLQLEAGDHEGAEQTLDSGLMEHPDFVPGLMVKAKLLMKTERADDAAPVLVRVLERDPMHLAAQRHLATVYIAQAKGKEAQALLQALKELDGSASNVPELPESLLNAIPAVVAPKLSMPSSTNELFIEKDALFASLEDAFLDEDASTGDEKSAADLRLELDAALASTAHVATAPEFFPADDPSVPGGDVSSLMAQMFGAEELNSKPEVPGAAAPVVQPPPLSEVESAPAASSFFQPSEAPVTLKQPASSGLFEKTEESAFSKPVAERGATSSETSSLFEKTPGPATLGSATLGSAFVKSEPVAPREQPKYESSASSSTPGGLDLASALDDLFGDDNDELPVELGTNTLPPEESSLEMPLQEPAPSADPELTQGVASALGGMFGEADELPVENAPSDPGDFAASEASLTSEAVANNEIAPPTEDQLGLRTGVAEALGGMFGEEEDLPQEIDKAEPESAEPESVELETTEQSQPMEATATLEAEPVADDPTGLRTGVAEALGGMFGEEDDLPVELVSAESSTIQTPEELSSSEEAIAESRGATTMDEILGGDPNAIDNSPFETSTLQLESISDSLYQKAEEPTAATENDEFRSGVAGAFGSLFGEFDELPVEGEKAPAEESFSYEASKDSPFADLLSALDEPVPHEEGASMGGSFAASLIENPTEPIVELNLEELNPTEEPLSQAIAQPIEAQGNPQSQPQSAATEESFSGGMSNALTNLFGAELDEDLSDLLDEKGTPAPNATSTRTLAELYLSQGHLRDALQVFLELESREPGDPEVATHIAEIQKRIDAGESDPVE